MRRGEVTSRLDCQFHLPDHYLLEEKIRNSGHPVYKLGEKEITQNIVDGPFGTQLKVEEYQETGIPLIRVSNCRTGEIRDDGELVFISKEKHQELIRSEVLPGDVLVTKAGAILGYTAVFPKELKKGNITSHLAGLRPSKNVVSEFLAWYLSSSAGIKQIYRWGNKTTRPELNTGEVRNILIPLPSQDVQRALVAEMESARAARQAKLSQAEELLKGIDGFVLEHLGLKLPKESTRKSFAARLKQLQASQTMNADYFHPERMEALKVIQKSSPRLRVERLADIADFLRDIANVQKDDNYLGLASVQSNTGELIQVEETADGQCFRYQKNDVLFGRLRPYLNKVRCAEEDGVCSTEFHVIRLRKEDNSKEEISPEYLAVILRSSVILAQTRHMMTGNTHPRLTNEDVVNLVVPIPKDINLQKQIVLELQRRRAQARALRETAEREWASAKENFEKALLDK